MIVAKGVVVIATESEVACWMYRTMSTYMYEDLTDDGLTTARWSGSCTGSHKCDGG